MKFEKPKSSIERVAGASSEAEKEILTQSGEIFSDQIFKGLEGKEREKTAEELEIIDIANNLTNEVRRRYGLDDFDVPPKNIHMIPADKWPGGGSEDGVYDSRLQGVAVKDAGDPRLYALSVTIHELLHFKSYNALQVIDGKKSEAESYRIGFATRSRDGKNKYFSELNEAMTEELGRRIFRESIDGLRDNPIFSDEINKTEEVLKKYPKATAKSGKSLFTGDTLYAKIEAPADLMGMLSYAIGKGSPQIITIRHSYKKQRAMLNSLIDKVWNSHKDEYENQEAVFEEFARCYMSGNLLLIGRLIEDTFGKGTFRKIAELDMKS